MFTSKNFKKSFKYSKNLLINRALVSKLVEESGITKNDTVIDIGAGTGNITAELIKKAGNVIAYELDSERAYQLNKRFTNAPNLTVLNEDFVHSKVPSSYFKIFANIPFNLTANILKKCLESKNLTEAYFIIQKEAAVKFAGKQLSEDENSTLISILYSVFYEFKISHRFNSQDFDPKPNVDIVLLKVTRRRTALLSEEDYKLFADYVSYLFNQNKESVTKSLAKIHSQNQIKRFLQNKVITRDTRPSNLKLDTYLELFEFFKILGSKKTNVVTGSYDKLKNLEKGIKKVYRTRDS